MRESVENIDDLKAAVCEYAKMIQIFFLYISKKESIKKNQVIGL